MHGQPTPIARTRPSRTTEQKNGPTPTEHPRATPAFRFARRARSRRKCRPAARAREACKLESELARRVRDVVVRVDLLAFDGALSLLADGNSAPRPDARHVSSVAADSVPSFATDGSHVVAIPADRLASLSTRFAGLLRRELMCSSR